MRRQSLDAVTRAALVAALHAPDRAAAVARVLPTPHVYECRPMGVPTLATALDVCATRRYFVGRRVPKAPTLDESDAT